MEWICGHHELSVTFRCPHRFGQDTTKETGASSWMAYPALLKEPSGRQLAGLLHVKLDGHIGRKTKQLGKPRLSSLWERSDVLGILGVESISLRVFSSLQTGIDYHCGLLGGVYGNPCSCGLFGMPNS